MYFHFIFSGYKSLETRVLFYDDIVNIDEYKAEKINSVKYDYFFGIFEDQLKKIVVFIHAIHYSEAEMLEYDE